MRMIKETNKMYLSLKYYFKNTGAKLTGKIQPTDFSKK